MLTETVYNQFVVLEEEVILYGSNMSRCKDTAVRLAMNRQIRDTLEDALADAYKTGFENGVKAQVHEA